MFFLRDPGHIHLYNTIELFIQRNETHLLVHYVSNRPEAMNMSPGLLLP